MHFFRRNIYSFVIFLTFIGLLISSSIFYTNFRKFNLTENEILAATQKRNKLTELYNAELKTVRAKRGYQFSKFAWELNQYRKAKKQTLAELESVGKLFEEEDYSPKFTSLERIILERLKQFDKHIKLIQSAESIDAKNQILNEEEQMREGSAELNQIFQELYASLDEEIHQKSRFISHLEQQNQWSFSLLLALLIILLVLIFYGIRTKIKGEIKQKEKELIYLATKESEDIFSSSFEFAPIGMALVSKTGNFLKVNNVLCDILGYNSEELIQKSFQELTYPKDLEKDLGLLEQLISGRINTYQMEKRYFHKNGHVIWAILGVSVVRNEDNSIKFFVSQIQDISLRKRTQQRLQKEKQRVSNILEGTNAATWEWKVQTGETIFNEKWANLIGYTLQELQPVNIDTWTQFVHPDDLEISNQKLADCFSGKTSYYESEYRMKHKEGHWVWILDRGKVTKWTKKGEPLWMFGTHIDITELKEINAALQKSEQRFKEIFNSAFQFMGFLASDGTLLEANKTALDFGGLQIKDVVGKKVWDTFWWTISKEVQDQLKEAVQIAARGETVKYEVSVWDKQKTPTAILFNLKPVFSSDSKHVEAMIAEGRPVQDIVDARNALLSKNEELKSFASVAAHDLREPLRTISSFMKLLKNKHSASLDEKGMEFINHSVDAAERMNLMIADLLEYASIGSDEIPFEKVNTAKIVREILALYKPVILEKKATVLCDNLPAILGQRTALRLLFQNIISNALKYNNAHESTLIEITASEKGSFQEFKIQDNGIGIAPKHHESIFLMFRRLHSKKEYSGTGMGLASCKKIVKQHGGEIWIESEPGKGSIFYFTLPKA